MKISTTINNSIFYKLLITMPLFLLLLASMAQYEAICNLGGTLREPTSLKTFIDDWIPFNIYIIYPYILGIWYVLFSGLIYSFYNKINLVKIASFYISVILMYWFCYASYLIYPTTAQEVMITTFNPSILNLRMFETLQILYAASTPLGDFPSLHVAPLVFMLMFLYKNWRSFFWVFVPFAFLGAIGTVLLKFHVFLGFVGGVLMGLWAYYFLYEKLTLRFLNKFVKPF